MTLSKRLLREPLLHFFAIGALLFGLYTLVSPAAPMPVNKIVVTPERVAQLAAGYQSVWRRPPNDDELRAMVDGFVREEVYYREALALGLDRDDPVIRRRLQQKMEFLSDAGTDVLEPKSGELEAYYASHQDRFLNMPRMSLEQIFLGENPASERITTLLASLQNTSEIDPLRWSERTLLPPQMGLSTPDAINAVFGAGFFEQLKSLPVGVWTGPVESAYGIHLVRIGESEAASVPLLEDVHSQVLREWKADKAQELRDQVYKRLRERYQIELPAGLAPAAP